MPMIRKQPYTILSLGGSLIVPDGGVDTRFLRRFRELILGQVRKGQRFIIICGGGTTARQYQQAADKVIKLTRDDLDWLGIHATRLNAHLFRTIFRDKAHPRIITDPREAIPKTHPIIVGAGWKPGCSTDYDAVLMAEKVGAKKLINLSNIRYVYDKDPRKSKDAKALPELTWKEFRAKFGSRWDPGLNSPFDPVASKRAQKLGMEVIVTEGKDLANIRNILNNKKFAGTVIH